MLVPSFLSCKNNTNVRLDGILTRELTLLQDRFYRACTVCKNNWKIMEEYGIMEYFELTV